MAPCLLAARNVWLQRDDAWGLVGELSCRLAWGLAPPWGDLADVIMVVAELEAAGDSRRPAAQLQAVWSWFRS